MVEIPMKAARKSLSSDCWEAIFSYLGDEDLKAVSLTCKDFWAYSSALKKSLKVVHPDIDMLSCHLNRFSHLKAIDLLEFQGDVERAICKIACFGVELEALHTSFPRYLSDFHRQLFIEVCLSDLNSNLKACSFSGNLGDTQLAEIATWYPNLEQLSFESCSFGPVPYSSGLELLASKLKLLKKIRFFSSHASDQFIVALSLNCVFLKEVTILSNDFPFEDEGGVTENAIGHLLQNRPNLEALWIECIVMDDSVSQSPLITIEGSISNAKALTSLVVCGMSNTDKVLMAIAKAKLRLNNLGLIACSDLTVSGLLGVLSNDHLTKLRIERARLRDEDMSVLVMNGDVGKLTHIEINQCHVTKWVLFLLLTKCPSLVDIRVIFPKLKGPAQNVPSSKNHKIQSLCLAKCYGISDKYVKHVGRLFPNLKVLNLRNCVRVTSTGIEAILRSCKHVTELNLAGFREAKMIKDDNSEFPELNLEVLKLSCSKIDDEGLAIIAKKCPCLVSLDLYACSGITTEGVKQVVESIKTLTCLNLYSGHNSFGALLEWMLSTGTLASLKRIFLSFPEDDIIEEWRDQFLQHGCLLLEQHRQQRGSVEDSWF